jgi:hypothetical protein
MEITCLLRPKVLLVSLVWLAISWCSLSTHADDAPVSGAMILAPTRDSDENASGPVEDTLKACLARIPEDSTMGQRMLAERGCQREEQSRQLIQTIPQF